MKSEAVRQIEQALGAVLPDVHAESLDNMEADIHSQVYLLGAEADDPHNILQINQTLREQADWQGWSERYLAFATNGVADYFVYDTSTRPWQVFYVDPTQTIEQSHAMCAADDFVFSDYDQWQAYILDSADEQAQDEGED